MLESIWLRGPFDEEQGRSKTWYRIRRRWFSVGSAIAVFRMGVRNRLSRSPIVSGETLGPVVSLTSHGARVKSVFLTVESIGRGDLKPSRVLLWLDDRSIYDDLPRELKRLVERGLEVRLTDNYGPHTKYFPSIRDATVLTGGRNLVSADDDILYPPWWLRMLTTKSKENPGAVVCFRALRPVVYPAEVLRPYSQWVGADSSTPEIGLFATGVSGVLYPSQFVERLRHAGTAFSESAPKADDVWLNHVALRSRIPICQVSSRGCHFWLVKSAQGSALMLTNWTGGNDSVIAALYRDSDVAFLSANAVNSSEAQ